MVDFLIVIMLGAPLAGIVIGIELIIRALRGL